MIYQPYIMMMEKMIMKIADTMLILAFGFANDDPEDGALSVDLVVVTPPIVSQAKKISL